ncbi:MAG: phosphoglucosamine mutase [Acidimicrobiales bacterium]
MSLRFGTDGVRGLANAELTPELVMALGRAAARALSPARMVVGRDTRVSGPMVQAALAAGLAAEGVVVSDLGVIPTPGAAWVAAAENVPAAVISASHNPFADNGIKFFAAGGRKLDDQQQTRLEALLDVLVTGPERKSGDDGSAPTAAPTGTAIGRLEASNGAQRYLEALSGVLPDGLGGVKVVVDCANGAASYVAPRLLEGLGAIVVSLADQPDGININAKCGSTHPQALAAAVVAHGADAGLAFDGDADRVMAVDHTGAIIDGDQILAVLATDRHRDGRLPGSTVVITVMSNQGLRLALEAQGISWVETPVGDRAVLEAMEAGSWALGGEQSGHIIQADLATTGDGILSGVCLLDVMRRRNASLADLTSVMARLPQVMRNVAVPTGRFLNGSAPWAETQERVAAALGPAGRVLVRASGTEPVVRVMVEAPTVAEAEKACGELCRAVERALT